MGLPAGLVRLLNMNEQKPKRRFWQIHLSTAMVMMMVMAALLFPVVTSLSGEDIHQLYNSAQKSGYTGSEENFIKSIKAHRSFEVFGIAPALVLIVILTGATS